MTQASPPTDIPNTGPSSLDLIDGIETLVSEGRRIPFSASVVVNEDRLIEIIDQIRLGMPQELVDAHHTVVDRDRIIAAAEEEAGFILTNAQDDAEKLVAAAKSESLGLVTEAHQEAAALTADHEIVSAAKRRADELVADAEARAVEVRSQADAYAREVMQELEGNLNRALVTVHKGLDALPAPGKHHRHKHK